MPIGEAQMRRVHLSGILLVSVFLFPALARGDSIATVDVSASFLPKVNPFSSEVFFGNGPSLFVTGQFTLDENTDTISSWNMTFLGPLGATYQLSAQNGGGAISCAFYTSSCGYPTFSFYNSNAYLGLNGLFSGQAPPLSLYAGETLELCPEKYTIYPGNVPAFSPPCDRTSGAFFNNQTYAIYELPNDVSSSGVLTVTSVVSTPEPSESTILLLGITIIFGCTIFKKRKSWVACFLYSSSTYGTSGTSPRLQRNWKLLVRGRILPEVDEKSRRSSARNCCRSPWPIRVLTNGCPSEATSASSGTNGKVGLCIENRHPGASGKVCKAGP